MFRVSWNAADGKRRIKRLVLNIAMLELVALLSIPSVCYVPDATLKCYE
jgi:hypothetical protein